MNLFEYQDISDKLENIDNNKYPYLLLNKSQNDIFNYYNELNKNIEHYKTNDDICTPMECVKTMIDYIPNDFWKKENLKILDPCCGNGNFGAYCLTKTNINNIYFNDLSLLRYNICKKLLNPVNITCNDIFNIKGKFDLIMANPPYSGGGNKNKSISNKIIEFSIDILNNNGYLCFITPNNWMTYNNNNTTLKKLLNNGSFLVIDNSAKKYFPQVGSSFTIFIWQKSVFNNITLVKNNYLIQDIQYVNIPNNLKFIPLYISQTIIDIIQKGIQDNNNLFNYRCDLHNFTKSNLLNDIQTDIFKYKTIHTAKKIRYAKIQQDIYNKWNIIVPLSTYYIPFIETNVNVTQSVGYISFNTRYDAERYLTNMKQNWIKLLVHITRYGNFNNILVLKHIKFDCKIDFNKRETETINNLIQYIKY